MSTAVHVAAVDLGASSGRVIVGTFTPDATGKPQIELTETRRFSHAPVALPTDHGERLYWDVLRLWSEIRAGLLSAARECGPLTAIGIDTWGVDYGLLDAHSALSAPVASYRSARTAGLPQELFTRIPADEFYAINGAQVQDFNTVFQLLAHHRESGLPEAGSLLLLPDLLTSWLTGKHVAEVTNASTTGLVDARTRSWSFPLLERLRRDIGLDIERLLPEIVEPGTLVGDVRPDVLPLSTPAGSPVPVVAVGSHDTASAVAAVPAHEEGFAYVSCGTWSLVGLELPEPVTTEESRAANFTNELGVDGTVRYLKNVMGLWVMNEAVRTWREAGTECDLSELVAQASEAEPLRTVVDINDPVFFAPGDMPSRIDALARASHQPLPRTPGEYVRCINDSLALAYRRALRQAARLSGSEVTVLHMVGGGIQNQLLVQLAADATGLPVIAGPIEATALGNIMVAARATGVLGHPEEVTLQQMRSLIRSSSNLTTFTPRADTAAAWDEADRRVFGDQ